MASDEVYTLQCTLNGATNDTIHFQSSFFRIFYTCIREHFFVWVNDILLLSATFKSLMELIKEFLSICLKWDNRLHPEKCILLCTETTCVRRLSSKGVLFDVHRTTGLTSISLYYCHSSSTLSLCTPWMKLCIPNYSSFIHWLHELPEHAYCGSGKRTKQEKAKNLIWFYWLVRNASQRFTGLSIGSGLPGSA